MLGHCNCGNKLHERSVGGYFFTRTLLLCNVCDVELISALGKYFNNGEPNTSITNYTNDLLALDKAEGIMETYNYHMRGDKMKVNCAFIADCTITKTQCPVCSCNVAAGKSRGMVGKVQTVKARKKSWFGKFKKGD